MQMELEKAEKEGKDTQPVYEKYGAISEKNREEAVASECSDNPFCSLAAWEMMNTGSEQGNSRLAALVSGLSSEEQAKLRAFVNAENAESAHAIYQALPDSVRVALQGKEILENAGLRGKVGGSGISAVGIIGSKTGRRPVNIIGKGSQLPDGYSPKDNSVIGPKGSVYSNTGKTDDYGNTVYSNNGGYYTFKNGIKTKVTSPNPPTNIQQNSEKGKEFEQKHFEKYQQENVISQREITIKTENGTKVRVDMIGKDEHGVINCVESKSSQTAPLTDNQKTGYPDLERNGGVIVGEGKPGFEGGTKLPPTKVEIVRPENEK